MRLRCDFTCCNLLFACSRSIALEVRSVAVACNQCERIFLCRVLFYRDLLLGMSTVASLASVDLVVIIALSACESNASIAVLLICRRFFLLLGAGAVLYCSMQLFFGFGCRSLALTGSLPVKRYRRSTSSFLVVFVVVAIRRSQSTADFFNVMLNDKALLTYCLHRTVLHSLLQLSFVGNGVSNIKK